MARGGFRVFICYSRRDGGSLATRLRRDLTSEGHAVWMDTQDSALGTDWTIAVETAIDSSNAIVSVVTQGAYLSPICRFEQMRALRKGKMVIPVIADSEADIPLYFESANYIDFSRASYHAQLSLLLEDLAKAGGSFAHHGTHAVALREAFRITHVTVPALPRNFTPLPSAFEQLRKLVIKDDSGPSIALTAVRGMGGIGKSILAQALAHDEVVQQAFPDGIVWIPRWQGSHLLVISSDAGSAPCAG